MLTKNRTYQFVFSIINWLEASVYLLTLGIYCPDWTFKYAEWYSMKTLLKSKSKEQIQKDRVWLERIR